MEQKKEEKTEQKQKRTSALRLSLWGVLASLVLGTVCLLGFRLVRGTPVVRYRNAEISDAAYAFLLASEKTELMKEYGISGTNDTAEFWASVCPFAEGLTYNEYLTQLAEERICGRLIASAWYEEGISSQLTSAQEAKLAVYLSDVQNAEWQGKDWKALAKEIGTDERGLREAALLDLRTELFTSYLLRYEGGLSADAQDALYHDHYVRVQAIGIYPSHAVQEDGTLLPLTGDDLTAKQERASTLRKLASQDLTESDLIFYRELYGEEPISLYYTDGWMLSPYSDFPLQEVLTEALTMEEGEVSVVETEDTLFVLLACPLIEGAYTASKYADWFSAWDTILAQKAYTELWAEEMPSVQWRKDRPTVADVPYSFAFLRFSSQ